MAQRTVAICEGSYIGIESIYTVIDGQQINIPEKLKEIRAKSRNNELFCPCGCGSNLILVAGDKNLREQHFRLKDGMANENCHVITEGKVSVDSKIVLKCWLDDKLQASDIKTRVPIHAVDDMDRKYEFLFLSAEKKTALSYCHERANLSDEKLTILESNSSGIHMIYVIDAANGGSGGQYPESLMKIQDRQGYCLLLDVVDADYCKANMKAVFYAQDFYGLWQEEMFAEGRLCEFSIDESGHVLFRNENVKLMQQKAAESFAQKTQNEKSRCAENIRKRLEEEERKKQEQERKLEEERIRLQQQKADAKKRQAELEEKQRTEEAQRQAEICQREEDFKRNLESGFLQQDTPIRDAEGNRWIKCEFCGKIAKDGAFVSYGGFGHVNLGTCKECSKNNPAAHQKMEEPVSSPKEKYNPNVCPDCGGTLREKSGQYGKFMGCSNYPICRFTRKIRK